MKNENLINDVKRVISSRVKVAAGTLAGAPLTQKVTSPAELLSSLKVYAIPATAGTIPNKTGYKILTGGVQTIPAPGSDDDSNYAGAEEGWMPAVSFIDICDINQLVQGPPHEITIQLYNSDSVDWHYFFVMTFTPKVELPLAPVTADEKDMPKVKK